MLFKDAALYYASQLGWCVFPVRPNGKTPLVNWRDESTTNPVQIEEWWGKWPTANIGLDCGASRVAVIDVDDLDSYDEWTAGKDMPRTLVSRTGKGGRHYLYWAPDTELRNSASKLARGIDVRGAGGFIVLPGSVHENGNVYQWMGDADALAEFPQWVLDQLAELKAERAKPEPPRERIIDPVAGAMSPWAKAVLEGEIAKVHAAPEGERNNTLFLAACKVYEAVKGGHIPQATADWELDSAAATVGLPYKEVEQTLRQAWERTEERHPAERDDPFAGLEEVTSEPAPVDWQAKVDAFFDDNPGCGGCDNGEPCGACPADEPVIHVDPLDATTPDNQRARSLAFPLYDLDTLATLPPPEWVLPHRIPVGLTFLYGDPGLGKTFVALDWCLTASAIHQVPILYFAGEGVSGIGLRIEAWKQAHPLLAPRTFWVVPQVPRMLDPHSVSQMVATIELLEEPPGLMVIDTFARCLVGGDENSAQDVGQVIDVIDLTRQKYGTSALVIHHTAKGGGRERGSGAIRGAADAMWRIDDAGTDAYQSVKLDCDKLKDGEKPGVLEMMLKDSGPSAVLYPSTPQQLGWSR